MLFYLNDNEYSEYIFEDNFLKFQNENSDFYQIDNFDKLVATYYYKQTKKVSPGKFPCTDKVDYYCYFTVLIGEHKIEIKGETSDFHEIKNMISTLNIKCLSDKEITTLSNEVITSSDIVEVRMKSLSKPAYVENEMWLGIITKNLATNYVSLESIEQIDIFLKEFVCEENKFSTDLPSVKSGVFFYFGISIMLSLYIFSYLFFEPLVKGGIEMMIGAMLLFLLTSLGMSKLCFPSWMQNLKAYGTIFPIKTKYSKYKSNLIRNSLLVLLGIDIAIIIGGLLLN